jgi:hypothetical protein
MYINPGAVLGDLTSQRKRTGTQWVQCTILMHGSILPVTTPPPPGNPQGFVRQNVPGVGNFIDRLVPGVGNIYNYGIYYIMPACNGLDLACEPVYHEIYQRWRWNILLEKRVCL